MLVTKALSQDVMLLAFVPLLARSRVSGQQMFSARKRSANVAAAAPMLVTKALSQDVMLLAFVPLLLIPEESPSLHFNQLISMAYVLTNVIPNFLMMCQKTTFIISLTPLKFFLPSF
ncbi:hypothetical protein [Lysinibacillus sp. NPDC093688]|uniref:hypothetical protein n=1 Tax=Lysinibacillus sp. NPDC093688 TaxID=3390577 RepID=UPI003D03D8FF